MLSSQLRSQGAWVVVAFYTGHANLMEGWLVPLYLYGKLRLGMINYPSLEEVEAAFELRTLLLLPAVMA